MYVMIYLTIQKSFVPRSFPLYLVTKINIIMHMLAYLPLYHFNLSDGKILVMGGMAASTDPKDFFMSFDITENRWQSLSPMPTPRYATFAFLIENKLYVIGMLLCTKLLFCVVEYIS